MKEQVQWKKIIAIPETYFMLLIAFFEMVFHFVRLGMVWDNVLHKLTFAVFYGVIFGIFVSLFPPKAAKVITGIITGLLTAYFVIQILYSGVFHTYLSVTGSIQMAGQAFDFTDVIWKEMKQEWWVLLLFLAPLLLFCVFLRKVISFDRHSLMGYGISIATAVLLFLLAMIGLQYDRGTLYSAYEVYETYSSVDMAVEKLGVSEALWLDVKAGIREQFGMEKEEVAFVAESYGITTESGGDGDYSGTIDTVENNNDNSMVNWAGHETGTGNENTITEEEMVIDTSPNILDVDFDALIAEEKNSNIVALHEYIRSLQPTNKNEYTGMFEGYNVIFVVAEGFSGYALDPVRTPTLYKMSTEGFHFKNYYTPLWYGSTLGGEYADLTGLMPRNGSYLSMAKAGRNKNDMMFTLSRQLQKKGYKTIGYHNNEYTYYDRHISHSNLGYEWIGVGNGYQPEKDEHGNTYWPQSDLAMIENTFDSYKDEQPFHVYYLTVSGHVMYNFGGNDMARRHRDMVENLDYSETTKAYLACQYELELAMERLNVELEMAGLAENTLIVLTADHVPYDNKDVLDELAGKTLDQTFEWYKNTLIIWSASMEESVEVDKYCYSLDILPTVSNLLGLPYDSRMMVGQDILSDSEGLVIFNDRSFITDKCSYNAVSGAIKSIGGSYVDEAYVESKQAQVKNKFSMAEQICDYDYYRIIDEAVYGTSEE